MRGYWKGLQAGYDPQDDEVEDYMYTEVTVEGTENGTELKQMNSFVVGEIRADCEVCFDSERVKTKEAGRFAVGSLVIASAVPMWMCVDPLQPFAA